jgi:thymidylate synthase
MLQEMLAVRLGVSLGEYYQYVGSMHVYDPFVEKLSEYIDEGFHRVVEMPAMPSEDPFTVIKCVLQAEHRIRNGERIVAAEMAPDPYWADIIRLVQVFWASGDNARLDELKAELAHPIYRSYLDERREMKRRTQTDMA